MKVWKRGHRGSDPSNPDELCTLVVEARLLSSWHTFVAFSLLSVLSRLQFSSLYRKSIRKKWSNNMEKTSTERRSLLMARPSMPMEVEKHMDGEIDTVFHLTLWMWDMVPPTTVDCFFWRYALFDGVLDSREVILPRGSLSSQSSGLTSHVSQIHLTYEAMENQLRKMQDMLAAEQEDCRETRESFNAFHT
jgi:hypothetical protein